MRDLGRIRGRLVVSCQAPEGSPLDAAETMAILARAAVAGGAGGIRARGAAHVAAIKAAVDVPVIGLVKRRVPGSPVYITPTFEDARVLVEAGADLVAIDATLRPRPDGIGAAALIQRIEQELGVGVVADVDSVRAGRAAAAAGATAVASTLAGYTGDAPPDRRPDLRLVRRLVDALDRPVIAEGRYATPAQVGAAFACGAHAVVVGEAITDPVALTRRLAAAAPGRA
jgi:N-acylglucosamine-6-phosphate 2-epimerase